MRPASFLAVLIVALATGGCGRDKVLVGGTPTPPRIYPLLVNPYSVMDALSTAYERRDTTEIKLLYDDAYQGSSIDQTDPAPAVLTFFKADEVKHVAALARAPILNVTLMLSINMTRFNDPADPPGWTTIVNPITSLEMSDSSTTWRVDIPNEMMEFKFVPHTSNPTSVDTTWKIVRWTEIKN